MRVSVDVKRTETADTSNMHSSVVTSTLLVQVFIGSSVEPQDCQPGPL